LVGRIPGQHLRRFHLADLPLEIKGPYLTGFAAPRQGGKIVIEIYSAAWTLIGFSGGKNDDISQYRLALWAPDSDVHKDVSDKEQ
jgi:hypothetical protein